MGGSQSSRKIGIDNNEPVGVIRVSENVAQRLKNLNEGGNTNNLSPSFSMSNPRSELAANHQNTIHQQPAVANYINQPFVTSSMIREQIEKELDKNDRYWENRIKSLQENQNRITHILEAEFNKACKEVENQFPTLAPTDATVPCQDYKSLIVDCLKNNANNTLNCSKVVKEFTSCMTNSRTRRSNEIRST